jgi:hypothetical protein
MNDREYKELRREINQTKRGAAAVGVCIARILAESDPTLPKHLNQHANEMYQMFCERGEDHAGEILFAFGRAVIDPNWFPTSGPPTN